MKRALYLLVVVSLFLSSCKKDPPDWKPGILLPIINSSMGIGNLMSDSLLVADTDSSLKIVYRYYFDGVQLDQLLKIPDTTLTKTASLKTIKLGTRIIETKITLGQLARENGSQGALILAAHGLSMPVPAIPATSGGVMEIDATDLFHSIEVKKGKLTASIFNDLPIELRDVELELRNENGGDIILSDTISSILPGATFEKIYPLDNRTFEGKLEAEVKNISSPGTGTTPVLIDTTDAVEIAIKINVEEVNSATAIFPAQNLIEQTNDVEYHLGGPELTFMKVKSGLFTFIVSSTLQDSGFITYSIPGATYQGLIPLYLEMIMPPAPKGDTTYIEQTRKVDDYWYDLTGKNGDAVNSFEQALILRIDSTGKMMDLSLEDSMYIYYTLYDVIPEYVRGYLGQDSFHYQGQVDVDLFKKISVDVLDIPAVNISLFVENAVGADAEVVVNEVKALNTKNAVQKSLSAADLSNPMFIGRALDQPLTAVSSSRTLSNSNADELIEILPDKLAYDVDIRLNPHGNTASHNDFIYHNSEINAGIELELPLAMKAEGIRLHDTLEFDFSSQELFESIESAEFTLFIQNTFPLEADVELLFVDEDYQLLEKMTETALHIPAATPEANGRVSNYRESELNVAFSPEKIKHIREAKFVVIQAVLNTRPAGQQLKIYDDYLFNVKVSADFIYVPNL
jgi:hypothetical protein